MTKIVKVRIGRDGKPSFDYSGFKGDDCFKENEKIWADLDGMGITPAQVTSIERKTPIEEKPQSEEQLEKN